MDELVAYDKTNEQEMSECADGTEDNRKRKDCDGYISIRAACESNANPLPPLEKPSLVRLLFYIHLDVSVVGFGPRS